MEHAVDEQPVELALQRRSIIGGLPAGRLYGDHDVAQQALWNRPGAACAVAVEWKTQHVGSRVLAAIFQVEPRMLPSPTSVSDKAACPSPAATSSASP